MASSGAPPEETGSLIGEVLGSPASIRIENSIRIDPLSVTSLYLKLWARKQQLSTATGFIVRHRYRHFLVSNWHVFAGRHPDTGELLSKTTGAVPDEVRIAHHEVDKLGHWRFVGESLINEDGSPRWVTHPLGSKVDVAALKLRNVKPWMVMFPLDLALADIDVEPYPGMAVCVIGFPLGLRENEFLPIWKTGHIASDPDVPHKNLPAFLIDATTREGMSGSPVVVRTTGGVLTRFLGVYASRVHEDAEVGRVWRPSAVRELLDHACKQDPKPN